MRAYVLEFFRVVRAFRGNKGFCQGQVRSGVKLKMKKHKPPRFALSLFLLGVFWVSNVCLFVSESKSDEGRRNPFSLPEGVVTRSKLPKKNEKEKLVLQAITVTDREKRIASISGENLMLGDEIFGKKIIIIGNDFVVLERGPEKIRLNLERPPFAVRISKEPEEPRQ